MAAIAKGEQRRALVIAAVGFVLVLGLFAGSRVVGGGGGGDEAVAPTSPPTTAPQTTPGTPGPAGGEAGDAPVVPIPVVPDSFEVLELRDPFTPPLAAIQFLRSLVPAPAPAPGEPTPSPAPSPSPSPDALSLRSVGVVDGETVATIDVGGDLFDASEGERFGPANQYMVVTLDVAAQCGTFLFGDEAFSLCVGQAAQPAPAPGSTPQK